VKQTEDYQKIVEEVEKLMKEAITNTNQNFGTNHHRNSNFNRSFKEEKYL
jgi:hypothetical protein